VRIDVGIGEFKYSKNTEDVIKTYGLGSCVALVVWSNKLGHAGLVHVALPEADVNPVKAKALPGYFADTGVPMVIDWVDKVSGGNRKMFNYRLYGGASILDESRRFDIGRRNGLAIKRLLWKYGCGIIKEDLGGSASRTITVTVQDGAVDVKLGQRQGGNGK